MDPHRHDRVTEGIREELNEMIAHELSDPRVGFAVISEVHVSPDYRRAHIQLILEGTPAEQADTLAAVDHAKHFLKGQLTERLGLFRTPELHFEAALPATLGPKATQILKRIRCGRPKPEKNPIS